MKFLGHPYPILRDARGLLRTQSGTNQIKADLLQLLLTNPGERCMLPDFGVPLKSLIFEPNDGILRNKARNLIANAIRKWEPRITIEQLEITSKVDESDLHRDDPRQDIDHILGIKIRFVDPDNIQEVQELRIEVPLAGG